MLAVLTSEMTDCDMVPVNAQPSCDELSRGKVEHKRRDAVREGVGDRWCGAQNVIDEEIAGDWYTGS